MRAVQYAEIAGTPRVVELPRPSAPAGGVLLQVYASGVCRSDWHAWQGHDPVRLPHVPGHEFAGVIAEIGSGVTGFALGQAATAPFVHGCGSCSYCRDGEAQVCPNQTQPGFSDQGSFAEYVVVKAANTNLVPLPAGFDPISAAALGCRFATSFRAVARHARLQPGHWLVVYGAGGVGLSALLIARAVGGKVLAVDISTAALALAERLGADATLDASGLTPQEIGAAVTGLTGGGAHASIDALGSPTAAEACLHGLRRRGRHVQVGLLLADNARPALPMDLVISRELELYGSHGLAAADYPAMLELASRLDLTSLIGSVIALDEAPAALAAMSRPATHPGITVIDLRPESR